MIAPHGPRRAHRPRTAAARGTRTACIAAALLLTAAPALAQTCTTGGSCAVAGRNVSIAIGQATHLTVTPATTALTTPNPAHYDAGFAATTGPAITINANTSWSLAISAATPTWSALSTQAEPARPDKPATDLLVAFSPAGPFTPLSTTPSAVAAGSAPGSSTTLFLRTLYAWNLDTPGDYAIQIVLTLTAP